jgi:hypothetical protein
MPGPQHNLGDIVSLTTHPFFTFDQEVIFMGDPLQQSPIMVVGQTVEIQSKRNSAEDLVSKVQHKCFWYSHKSNGFNSAWISETFLKKVEKYEDKTNAVPPIGTIVIFRTTNIEQKKQKSSLITELENKKNSSLTITSLTSFVCPMLIVSGYKIVGEKNDCSKAENESASLEARLIKVKWFNFTADKVSDTYLPLSCIRPTPPLVENILTKTKEIITNGEYLKTLIGGIETFIKPLSIHFLSGVYYLRAHEIITNRKINSLEINELVIISSTQSPVLKRAPLFDFAKSEKARLYPIDLITEAIETKHIIRIKYINRHKKVSIRCLKDIKLYKFKINKKEKYYVTGFCMSKNDIRYFNIKRVEWAEILDLSFDPITTATIPGIRN